MTVQGVTRWAVLGTGGIARRTIGDLRRAENIEVLAVGSRTEANAGAFARDFDIPRAYGDIDELLKDPDIDVVYVCTPHASHFDYSIRAIRAGKNVLCEKPLALTASEARELQSAALEHRVFLMEAMWMKFNPVLQRALAVVAAGGIGQPRYVQAGMGFPVSRDAPVRFWDPALGGGALLDLGVYTVAIAQLFLGSPTNVDAVGRCLDDGVDLWESITLGFGNGGVAQLTSSMTFWASSRAVIGGDSGMVVLEEPFWAPKSLTHSIGAPPDVPWTEQWGAELEGNGYVPMFRAVSNAVHAGELEHHVHPVSAAIGVLDTLDLVRPRLLGAQNSNAN